MLSSQKLRYMSKENGLLSCKFIGRTKRNPPKHIVRTKRILIKKQAIIGNWTFLRVWRAHVCMVAMSGHRAAELRQNESLGSETFALITAVPVIC